MFHQMNRLRHNLGRPQIGSRFIKTSSKYQLKSKFPFGLINAIRDVSTSELEFLFHMFFRSILKLAR